MTMIFIQKLSKQCESMLKTQLTGRHESKKEKVGPSRGHDDIYRPRMVLVTFLFCRCYAHYIFVYSHCTFSAIPFIIAPVNEL